MLAEKEIFFETVSRDVAQANFKNQRQPSGGGIRL